MKLIFIFSMITCFNISAQEISVKPKQEFTVKRYANDSTSVDTKEFTCIPAQTVDMLTNNDGFINYVDSMAVFTNDLRIYSVNNNKLIGFYPLVTDLLDEEMNSNSKSYLILLEQSKNDPDKYEYTLTKPYNTYKVSILKKDSCINVVQTHEYLDKSSGKTIIKTADYDLYTD